MSVKCDVRAAKRIDKDQRENVCSYSDVAVHGVAISGNECVVLSMQ